jgi:hypothetical protein
MRVIDQTGLRIKEKLRNAELAVTGDQWPIFLYHGYQYDEEDPWNGLFRSSLLVTVRSLIKISRARVLIGTVGLQAHIHITKFCREGAQSHSLRQCTHSRHDPSVPRICGVRRNSGTSLALFAIHDGYSGRLGSLCFNFVPSIFKNGHCHRFGDLLLLGFGTLRGCGREGGGNRVAHMVEPVCTVLQVFPSPLAIHYLSPRQIFPNYAMAQRAVSKNSALARIRERRALLRRAAATEGN